MYRDKNNRRIFSISAEIHGRIALVDFRIERWIDWQMSPRTNETTTRPATKMIVCAAFWSAFVRRSHGLKLRYSYSNWITIRLPGTKKARSNARKKRAGLISGDFGGSGSLLIRNDLFVWIESLGIATQSSKDGSYADVLAHSSGLAWVPNLLRGNRNNANKVGACSGIPLGISCLPSSLVLRTACIVFQRKTFTRFILTWGSDYFRHITYPSSQLR